jgi:hypothetical protein
MKNSQCNAGWGRNFHTFFRTFELKNNTKNVCTKIGLTIIRAASDNNF